VQGISRFRANVFQQRGVTAMVLRQIPYQIHTFEQLGLPPICRQLINKNQGLVLVTGPTGSGKSTTLATMVDTINTVRKGHIITIEDPIEFVHQHKKLRRQPARGQQRHQELPRRAEVRAAPGPRRDPGR
jgi:twitching motility protein PilT